jgi:hypothetical protein
MRTFLSETLATIASGHAGLAQLVEMDLDIPWHVNTSSWDLSYNGKTYLGVAAAMGRIDVINDAVGEIKPLMFELPAVRDQDVAKALDANLQVQGRAVRVYTAVFRTTNFTIIEAILEWAGRLDTMTVVDGSPVALIQVTAEHIGMDLLRPSGMLYTDQDQQKLHPGDRSWQYVVDQSEKRITWPAADFFKQ